jgi:hypothetical protein
MADSRRIEPQPAAGAADRESRAEALLVEGLDRYFAGHYDDAIHLWTRVLFLDRSHARARAYIDRARTALAERQRRADEILHTAGTLVSRGEVAEARRQLMQAVAISGEDERVAALRTQLDRLERANPRSHSVAFTPAAVVDVRPVGAWKRRVGSLAALLAAGAVGGLLVMLVMSPAVHEWLRAGGAVPAPVRTSDEAAPRILAPADVALVRARTLYAHGRLAEALAVLERLDASGPSRPEADRLRTEIQTVLLGTRARPQPSGTPRSIAVRP